MTLAHYQTVQLPFSSSFEEASKADLKTYFSWFFEIMPERLSLLQRVVNSTPHYEKLTLDKSSESLVDLGDWFRNEAEGRDVKLSETEKKLISKFSVEDSKFELTNKTLSLAFDIGMYFSQVMMNSCEGLKWEQPLKNKRFVDYGQPVLRGKSIVPCNPVRLVIFISYDFAQYHKPGKELFELFSIWSESIMKE